MTVKSGINKKQLRRVNVAVKKCQKDKRKRATVAIVVEHVSGPILIIYSNDTTSGAGLNPGLPKGGIWKKESLLVAAARELQEEVGIELSDVDFTSYIGAFDVRSLRKKSGFATKHYFVVHARYDGPLKLEVEMRELSGYQWVAPADLKEILRPLRKKRKSKFKALAETFARLKKRQSALAAA